MFSALAEEDVVFGIGCGRSGDCGATQVVVDCLECALGFFLWALYTIPVKIALVDVRSYRGGEGLVSGRLLAQGNVYEY